MHIRLGWRILPALVGLGCLIGVAQADGPSGRPAERPSHVPVPSRGGPTDPEQLFSERLHKAEMFRDLRDQVEKAFGGKKLDDLLKDLKRAGINPNSPEFAKLLQEELRRQANGGATLKPEQLETLRRLLKDLFPEGMKPPDLPIDPFPIKPPERNDPPPLPGDKPPDSDTTGNNIGKAPEWVKTPEDREALEEASRQLAQMARRLDGWSDGIRNSPALQHAAGDLARLMMENSNGRSGGLNSVLARWNQLSKHGEWLSKSWMQLRTFEFPRLPSIGLPSVHLGGGSSSLGAASYSGAPSGVLLAGLGVGVAVWFLFRRLGRYSWGSVAVADTWQLGPWPVAPEAVASRSDLVQAFEHLSLLLLGRKAMNLNHHEIAVRIGNAQAERLASLYERARYAPQDEPVAEQDVVEFRRDLCQLAGVQSA